MRQLKRTWAEINLDNLEYNYKLIRALLSPGTKFMAVVKADAYGHGSAPIAQTLERCGADWFGVSNINEAIALRKAGITKKILILGHTPVENVRQLFDFDITQTLLDFDYGQRLAQAAEQAGVVVDAHIKLDTGMTRIGFQVGTAEDIITDIARLYYLPSLKITGIFTHFAAADEPGSIGREFTKAQHRRFMSVCDELRENAYNLDIHCCNSAATLIYPEYHHDMVRPGIILYGQSPNGRPIKNFPIRPVMTLKTVVSLVKTVREGEKISYGCTYETKGEMRVATVPVGYADGYPRALSNRGKASVNGKLVPIVGRVCMDQMMLDVSGVDVSEGDTVTLFEGESSIGVDDIAS
ncbi:MAG: alanine racemase, partial [Oscillospiraceae bacterium]